MADRLLRRATDMSPQARAVAAAVVLAKSPRARRVAKWILLARGLRPPSAARVALPGKAAPARAAKARSAGMGLALLAGTAAATAFVVREFPAIRREIKIWLM